MFNHIERNGYVFKDPVKQAFEGKDSFMVSIVVNCPTGIKGLGKFYLIRCYGKKNEHDYKTMADYFNELKKGDHIVFNGLFEYYEKQTGDKKELGEYIKVQSFYKVDSPQKEVATDKAAGIDDLMADIPF